MGMRREASSWHGHEKKPVHDIGMRRNLTTSSNGHVKKLGGEFIIPKQLKVRYSKIVMRRLTTGIRSGKCVVRRFRLCPNVMVFTYTNLETWHLIGLLMDESPFRHPFPEQGGYIHIEELLWQIIFLHNQLISYFQ
jgi:hypothetical protein